MAPLSLVWPAREYVPGYVDALQRGWSPDNLRGLVAAQEELLRIRDDIEGFLAVLLGRDMRPVTLLDGTTAPRIPGYRKWMWDGEFCGSIGLRWQQGTEA